jgi:hypothetical protein
MGRFEAKKVKQFAATVRPYIKESDLEGVRRYSKRQGKSPDWPWNRFVHEFASNGGNWHFDKNICPNFEKYNWQNISRLTNSERKKTLEYITNPRRRHAGHFERLFQVVKKKGGPAVIKREYNAINDSKGRIAYWKKSFPGR